MPINFDRTFTEGLDFDDVLIVPRRTSIASRSEVDLSVTLHMPHTGRFLTGVPIFAANMDGVGTVEMANALSKLGLFTCLSKENLSRYHEVESPEHVFVTVGLCERSRQVLKELLCGPNPPDKVCVDVANGYMGALADYVTELRANHPDLIIVAGNVVTPDGALDLYRAGADIIKVGIGGGSVCTTRIKTGVGVPQLSAIDVCSAIADKTGFLIMSDGGCRTPADVAKAFAAGADMVMLGGMLAGHSEGGGERTVKLLETREVCVTQDGEHFHRELKEFVQFYGMSSDEAMKKHNGGVGSYRTSEGRVVQIPFKGPVDLTIQDVLGGLRSACTYTNAKNMLEFQTNATFVKVRRQFNNVFVK